MKVKQSIGSEGIASGTEITLDGHRTDLFYGMNFSGLQSTTIISAISEINHLCLLQHDEWYMKVFSFSVSDNVFFNYLPFYQEPNHSKEDIELCKKLFIMKMFAKNPKTGKNLRATTMQETFRFFLKLNKECASMGVRISEVFSNHATYLKFHATLPNSMNRTALSLIRTLHRIDSKELGFSLNPRIFSHITEQSRTFRKKTQQHPIIPSRILLLKFNQYHEVIDDYISHHDQIKKFLSDSIKNPYLGKSKNIHYRASKDSRYGSPTQMQAHISNPQTFEHAATIYNLEALKEKYLWSATKDITAFISLAMYCAKQLVHLFTMMRDHEVKSLRLNCLEPVKGWNNEALYVIGTTTKLQSWAKPSKWITNDAIRKPIMVLEKINEILSPHAVNEKDSLFLSTALHPASNAKSGKVTELVRSTARDRLPPVVITEEDIRELELIDPVRNWRGDSKYKVGAVWKISSHQFRRSMAVFAGQSGLISLPALKRALGHLSKIMTIYYTKGCSAGNYLFGLINPELAHELRAAKQEADGAIFVRDALESSERLFRTRGKQIMHDQFSEVFMEHNKQERQQLLKLGLMAITETPVGWCASVSRCDKRAHGNYFTCPGCRHLIGSEKIMEQTLSVMRFDLQDLDINGVEYRAEKQNILDFEALRDRIISKV